MPILIDFSAIAMGAVFTQGRNLSEGMLRHQILNSLRMYNVKYRATYGKMIIACDGGSWRKEVFPEYKGKRASAREADSINWDEVWDIINKVKIEIDEFMPYSIVQAPKAEADDVIATLVETTQEFGSGENVMIISADKDFVQLQKYGNVKQFSTVTKKLVTDKNPRIYLKEHVIRGCGGDGVPNIFSDNDTFLNETKRQTPISAKKLAEMVLNYEKLDTILESSVFEKFDRNRKCIDFDFIPEEISTSILAVYNEQLAKKKNNTKVFNYLIAKRCNNLIGCVEEFFQK